MHNKLSLLIPGVLRMVLFWTTIVLLNFFAYIIPKHLPRWQLYSTSIFAVMLQQSIDVYFDLKWDLYGYFNKGVDTLGFVVEYGIFPAVNMIFLNFWVIRKGFQAKLGYLLACCCIAIVYEFMALKSGYFYYNGWKLIYSMIQYPILFLILVGNLRLIQHFYNKQREERISFRHPD